jgi:hypothetical protein
MVSSVMFHAGGDEGFMGSEGWLMSFRFVGSLIGTMISPHYGNLDGREQFGVPRAVLLSRKR